MTPEQLPLLAAAVLVVAFLYSSVGHAGASGYIAVMALAGLSPVVIRPTALALNILVAAIAAWQFRRARHFSWRLFWPFALPAVPMAFVGGYVTLPTQLFQALVGVVLFLSAARFFARPGSDEVAGAPSLGAALALGGGIGLLSGLTGTGGGIFLTPMLLFMKWAPVRTAGAVSALFILLNSTAGLLGNLSATRAFPLPALALLATAGAGGLVGSYLGSSRLPPVAIKRLLAVVLVIAGLKLVVAGLTPPGAGAATRVGQAAEAASAGPGVGAQEACPATPGQAIMALVNGERAARGLPPFTADTLLARAAWMHAEDMARTGVVSHDGSDGSDPSERLDAVEYPWTWVGENVAAGQEDPLGVVAGWMRSEAHRNNVLHDDFTSAGVALVRSDAGRWGTFWVMVYGTAKPPSAAVVRCHP